MKRIKKIKILLIIIIVLFSSTIMAKPKTIIINKEKLLNLIEKDNFEVINKRDNITYSKYEIDETKSLSRPNIQFQTNASRINNPNISSMNNYNWTISLRQPLFTYGKIRNALEIAKHYYTSTEIEYKSTLRQTKLSALIIFYTIKVLEHKQEVLESTEKSLNQHYQNVLKRRDVGTATLLDALTAQVNYKQIRPQIINLKNEISNVKNDLKILLNIDLETDLVISTNLEIEDLSNFNKNDLENDALKNNEDIKILLEQLKINEYQQGIAKNQLRPDLYLVSNYGGNADKIGDVIDKDEYYVGLNLTFPLYDGKESKNQLKKHQINHDINKRRLKLIENNLINRVKQDYNNLLQYSEQISVNTLLVEQAAEAYRIAYENYSMGLAINTDVIDAEKNKLNAKILLLESQYNYIISSINLKYLINIDF